MSNAPNTKQPSLPKAQDIILPQKDVLRVEYARDYDGDMPRWRQTTNMPARGTKYSYQAKLIGKSKPWITVGIFGPQGLDLVENWEILPSEKKPKLIKVSFLDGAVAGSSANEEIAQVYCSCGKCPCPHRFAALYLAFTMQGHAKKAPQDIAKQQAEYFIKWWPTKHLKPNDSVDDLLSFAESSYLMLKKGLDKINLDSSQARGGLEDPTSLGLRLSRNEKLLAQSRKMGKNPLVILSQTKGTKN